nr:sodium-coupled monocarboxylate transporter 2-like [Onthophagus taurus]
MENSTLTLQDILGIKFTWYDYSFFLLMLLASAIIGVYYGFYKKQQTAEDYLFGGKSLGIIPMALSLTANNISGIALLAVPSDVYKHGISFWFTYVSLIFVIFASYKIFVPVFAKLKTTSTFEYLKLRYDTKTRLLGSILYLGHIILVLPIVIYIPALALVQATGINLHLINILLCAVCIFYTSIGGLKAVVYSDALQSIVMIGALAIAFTLGVIRCGGIENIWNTSYENERLTLVFDLDFTKRNGFWAVLIGQFIAWMSFMGINQTYIQKCLALPSQKDITKVLIMFAIGLFIIGSLCNFTGLIMFTEYSTCDPLEAGILQKQDQLLPYYIMDIAKQLPGLAGFFIAGVFSAALSTMSGMLNSLSCTIFEDFISHRLPKNTSQRKISTILKLIVVIIGVISTINVFIVEKLGGMLALANSLSGITAGPILALFAGGMLIPKINSKGAFCGTLISVCSMAIVVLGSQWYQINGYITTPPLPVSIEGCPLNGTFTTKTNINITLSAPSSQVPYIFKVPFYWYSSMGLIISLVFGIIISQFVKDKKSKILYKDLFSPVIHRFLTTKDEESSKDVTETLMVNKFNEESNTEMFVNENK